MALIIAFPNFGLCTSINVVFKGCITCCKELILRNIGQLHEQGFSGMRARGTTLQTCLMQASLQTLVKELVLPQEGFISDALQDVS